jgi:hypothetical protein
MRGEKVNAEGEKLLELQQVIILSRIVCERAGRAPADYGVPIEHGRFITRVGLPYVDCLDELEIEGGYESRCNVHTAKRLMGALRQSDTFQSVPMTVTPEQFRTGRQAAMKNDPEFAWLALFDLLRR